MPDRGWQQRAFILLWPTPKSNTQLDRAIINLTSRTKGIHRESWANSGSNLNQRSYMGFSNHAKPVTVLTSEAEGSTILCREGATEPSEFVNAIAHGPNALSPGPAP